jgi:hypothetical protein
MAAAGHRQRSEPHTLVAARSQVRAPALKHRLSELFPDGVQQHGLRWPCPTGTPHLNGAGLKHGTMGCWQGGPPPAGSKPAGAGFLIRGIGAHQRLVAELCSASRGGTLADNVCGYARREIALRRS